MTNNEINQYRLINQQLEKPEFKDAAGLVSRLCGIQAQDYTSAKWAIGIRAPGITNTDIKQAFADKSIVRTWLMRGTLHIVAAPDIRWLLKLISPRFITSETSRLKELELDDAVFSKTHTVLTKALIGGKQLTREELTFALGKYGVQATGVRMAHILQRAAFQGLICFGSKRGTEFTYTLLDEWVPQTKQPSKEEMLAELAKRYFTSRGPATLDDFVWWSGLTVTDAKEGLELIKSKFNKQIIDGQTYWFSEKIKLKSSTIPSVFLLPAFDEYLLGYKDRSASIDDRYSSQVISSNGIFFPVIVIDGKIAGLWKRHIKKDKVEIQTTLFGKISKSHTDAIVKEAEIYSKFTEKDLVISN